MLKKRPTACFFSQTVKIGYARRSSIEEVFLGVENLVAGHVMRITMAHGEYGYCTVVQDL